MRIPFNTLAYHRSWNEELIEYSCKPSTSANQRSTNDVLTEYSNNFINTSQSKLNNYGSLNMNLINSINNSLYLDLKIAVFSLLLSFSTFSFLVWRLRRRRWARCLLCCALRSGSVWLMRTTPGITCRPRERWPSLQKQSVLSVESLICCSSMDTGAFLRGWFAVPLTSLVLFFQYENEVNLPVVGWTKKGPLGRPKWSDSQGKVEYRDL